MKLLRVDMKKAFVIGDPIVHSKSPLIHNYWLKEAGVSGIYEKLHIKPSELESFILELKSKRLYCGGNITIPHKQSLMTLVDYVDPIALEIGAANTVWFDGDTLKATNTDGFGFGANLDQNCLGWDKGTKAVVLGAGGASRAVVQQLKHRGFLEIHLINRTVSRAQELALVFGETIHPASLDHLNSALKNADIFVNTSSLGMDGAKIPFVDFSKMAPGAVVTDIVYSPLETEFLKLARKNKLKTVDGLGMLLHQAAPGFEKWFGSLPKVTNTLKDIIVSEIEGKK